MKTIINNIRSNVAMRLLELALGVFPKQERVIVAKAIHENMDALVRVKY